MTFWLAVALDLTNKITRIIHILPPFFTPIWWPANSHPPASSPQSYSNYQLVRVQTNTCFLEKHVKPANHIFWNCCSCCVTGQRITLGEKCYSPSSTYTNSQMVLIVSVAAIGREERTLPSSHPENMANFSPQGLHHRWLHLHSNFQYLSDSKKNQKKHLLIQNYLMWMPKMKSYIKRNFSRPCSLHMSGIKSSFMFEELLASPQPAVYLESHRSAIASANDRRPDRSPTTQMNRGALTAGGLLLRWDFKLLFSLSPVWWEITLELVRLLLFNSLFSLSR